MNQIDTNTLIAICTCAIGLTQFILWKHIAKVKAYEAEKGKNLATKEDIAEITKEIESVKDSYNKALALFNMKLLNEHEFSKSLIEICNHLDKELINHLIECKKDFEKDGSYEAHGEYGQAIGSVIKLGDFLRSYESRYSNLKDFNSLLKECNEMYSLSIDMDYPIIRSRNKEYITIAKTTQKHIKDTLKTLIPPIKASNISKWEVILPIYLCY